MPFRQTIAAKIFGLAIILLLLTIALAGFLLYEVTRTTEDLTIVANFDVPLTQSFARLDEFGLRRRLAFERWFGALNASEPNHEIVVEATENYALFSRKLTDEFSTACRINCPKNSYGCANATTKLGERTLVKTGIWPRKLFANVWKFGRVMARPVFSWSEFNSSAEMSLEKIGTAFGISGENRVCEKT